MAGQHALRVASFTFALVAGCGQTSQQGSVKAPAGEELQESSSSSSQAMPCRGADCRILTPDGWAGIRAGMPVEAAFRISRLRLLRPGHYDEFFSNEPQMLERCNIYRLIGAPSNISVFVESGIITSIGAELSDEHDAAIFRTDEGIVLGAPEAAVRHVYNISREAPIIHSGPSDKELFVEGPGGNGTKFSIIDGKVAAINVGGRSINYEEGCL